MSDPTITCPSCKQEIRLTESLAAPLIASTRRELEQQLAQKEADFSKREQSLQQERAAIAKSRESIDEQVQTKLKEQRGEIAAEESKKARLALSTDLENKSRQVAELNEVLKQRDAKLAEAQNAQAELIRKQRELDDAKREM